MVKKYLNDQEVANLLNMSVDRLRNKAANKEPLPDRSEPEGCRVRLWPEEKVYEWLESYMVVSTPTKRRIASPQPKARRGRPRKSVQKGRPKKKGSQK